MVAVLPPWGSVLLSILIPAYQEEASIAEILRRVGAVDFAASGFEVEIFVCDDGSTDRTRARAEAAAAADPRIHVLGHDAPRGKGAAVRTGLAAARGEWCLIQDAELSYEPSDYAALLGPVAGGAEAIYGSRFLGKPRPTGMPLANFVANRMLAVTASLLYGNPITDEATWFKLVRTDLLRALELTCDGFDLGAEMTAKLGRRGVKIVEVPIAYSDDAAAASRRAHWRDGPASMWELVKHRLGRS